MWDEAHAHVSEHWAMNTLKRVGYDKSGYKIVDPSEGDMHCDIIVFD